MWDSVRLGQNTCDILADVLEEGRSKHTDRSLSLRIVLFRDVVCALILKVRCIDVSIKVENTSRGAYFRKSP